LCVYTYKVFTLQLVLYKLSDGLLPEGAAVSPHDIARLSFRHL